MSIAMQDHYANQKTDVDELIKTHSDLVRKIAWQVHGLSLIHISEPTRP